MNTRIDVEKLKAQTDLRQIVERDLGRPRFRGHTYAAFRCPLHHEHKGYSLVVYAERWQCFGKCHAGGDAIAWVQHYHQLTFQEACERLAMGDLPRTEALSHRQRPPEPLAQPPDPAWQAKARRIIDEARDRLWSAEGQRALGYLVWERGLSEEMIRLAQLGYLPGAPTAWREIDGLHVPCGILLPWVVDDAVWGIKVRRDFFQFTVGQYRAYTEAALAPLRSATQVVKAVGSQGGVKRLSFEYIDERGIRVSKSVIGKAEIERLTQFFYAEGIPVAVELSL